MKLDTSLEGQLASSMYSDPVEPPKIDAGWLAGNQYMMYIADYDEHDERVGSRVWPRVVIGALMAFSALSWVLAYWVFG